jgi:hypothetical protein
MSKTCNNCGTDKKPSSVPYAVLEDFKETAKANSLKWFIICLVLIVLLVGSNIGWLVYEGQYEDITETITQEVEQDADNGENYFVGGDMVGETKDKNNQSN